MTDESSTTRTTPVPVDVVVVVVGAGFSGLYITHQLVQAGPSVLGVEAGTDVGGTWHWNRYPGARTDSEASFYAYTLDHELSIDDRRIA